MLREVLIGKIHRATVTEADLNYVGSITIDEELMEAANMREFELVHIWNIDNGERFQTYTIKGKRGSGVICLNGAAARKVSVGDKVIIAAFGMMEEEKLEGYQPNVVIVDDNNKIIEQHRGM
ncbi:aspartate 1-decarboxylase [Hippea maritima]|uniref:Aspartate 1-decarboxylase n=1 Tax=Hippea maritima (strain ATCC 700847 / DSM 10411 / MH2) TaxID=760142 RepID=F2LWA4_HIPMA|nr:aspartate 1-decarboxylase [Hippea maritima]AEA34038.1 Aspartate 1-decarboxylase [Hippea maritima DSM 10411]